MQQLGALGLEGQARAPAADAGGLPAGPESGLTSFVNTETKSGSSPLMFAVKNSHTEATEVLIREGKADCNKVDDQVRRGTMM